MSLRPVKAERLEYNVDYPSDTEFSAHARLLQSKWRKGKTYPEFKLGNFLEIEFAKQTKSNFLTDNIRALVTKEVINIRKAGGLVGEPRIWNNLLSSQPLCFNLFGEMYYDLDLATVFFKRLFPSKVEQVTAIRFEHSPGRRDSKYIGDRSAFDVFVEYSRESKKGFMGIEVKYAESLREEDEKKANKNFKERYITVTESCGIFKDQAAVDLRKPPLSQIWRDHLLSITTRQDYDEGFFVFLFPAKNEPCQTGVNFYREYLISTDENATGFYPRHLEEFIYTLIELKNSEWTRELGKRYLGVE